MALQRVFTSFDFDHVEDLRNLLVGQARHEDTPFELADWSVKEAMTGDWKKKVPAGRMAAFKRRIIVTSRITPCLRSDRSRAPWCEPAAATA